MFELDAWTFHAVPDVCESTVCQCRRLEYFIIYCSAVEVPPARTSTRLVGPLPPSIHQPSTDSPRRPGPVSCFSWRGKGGCAPKTSVEASVSASSTTSLETLEMMPGACSHHPGKSCIEMTPIREREQMGQLREAVPGDPLSTN